MNILIFGGTNGILTTQKTEIFLDDYPSKKISKQNLLDMLLSEIYDDRDGIILRHINNVEVNITRMSDNELISEITSEGFYTIRMFCEDSDNNIGKDYWINRNQSLNVESLTIYVKQNKAPVVILKEKRLFNLSEYPSSIIDRNNLNSELVYKVIDDRDGLISTDILNIRIYQTGEESLSGTSGTNWFYPNYGTSGITSIFKYVNPVQEIIYINEIGEYKMNLKVSDSLGSIRNVDFMFDVFD